MCTGKIALNGKNYYFDTKTGALLRNQTQNGYTTNADGVIVKVLLNTPYLSQAGYPTGCVPALSSCCATPDTAPPSTRSLTQRWTSAISTTTATATCTARTPTVPLSATPVPHTVTAVMRRSSPTL